MVELPDDLADEQRQSFTLYATNTTHLTFHDAPKTFYVVRVDVAADVLVAGVVHELMDVAELRLSGVSF